MAMNYQHQYPQNRVMNKNPDQISMNQHFKKPMVPNNIPQEALEDGISFLPDIYTRKCRIVEQLHYTRPQYYPISVVENKRLKRPLSQWDLILEEMKKRHLDYKEEKKAKQAIAFKIAKTIKKDVTKNVYKKDEIAFQQASTGALLQILILNSFDEVSYQKNIEYVEQKTVQQKLEEERIKKAQEELKRQQQQQQQIIQQQNYDIDEFFMEDEEKKKEEEQRKLEEQRKKEEEEMEQRKKEEEKLANQQKLENQTVKWPKIARFIKKMTDLNPEEYDYDQDFEDQIIVQKKEEDGNAIQNEQKQEEPQNNQNIKIEDQNNECKKQENMQDNKEVQMFQDKQQSEVQNQNNKMQEQNELEQNNQDQKQTQMQEEVKADTKLPNDQNEQQINEQMEEEVQENQQDQQIEQVQKSQENQELSQNQNNQYQQNGSQNNLSNIPDQQNNGVSNNQIIENNTQNDEQKIHDLKRVDQQKQDIEEELVQNKDQKQIEEIKIENNAGSIQNNKADQQQQVAEEIKQMFRIKGLKQMRVIKKYELIKTQLKEIQNRLGSKKKEKEFVDIYPIETVNSIIKPFTEKFSQISKEKQEAFQQQVMNPQNHDDKSETNSIAPQSQIQQSQADHQNINSTLSNLIPGQPTMSQASVIAYQQQQYNAQAIQKTEIEKMSGICLTSKFLDTMKKRRRREENNKDNFNEEFMNSATQLNPNLEFRRSKYENISELLYLNFDANAMKDANEFKGIFEKTAQNNNNRDFPKSWDQIEEIPLLPKSYVDVNKGCLFDNEYENFLYANNAELPSLFQEYSQKLNNVFKSKNLLISQQYLDQIKNMLEDQAQKNTFLKLDTRLVIGGNFLQKMEKEKIFSLIFKRSKQQQNKKQISSTYEYSYEIVLDKGIREKQKINQFSTLCLYFLLKQQLKLWGNKQKQIIKGFKTHTFTKDILIQEKLMEVLYIDYQIKQHKKVVLLDEKILPAQQNYISMRNIWDKKQNEIKKQQEKEVEENSSQQNDSIEELMEKFQNKQAVNGYMKKKRTLSQKFTNNFLEFQNENQNLVILLKKEYNHKQMEQNPERKIEYEKQKFNLPTFNQVKNKALKKFSKLKTNNSIQKVQDITVKISQLPKLDKGQIQNIYQPLNRQKKILNKGVLFFYQAIQELNQQELKEKAQIKYRQTKYMPQQNMQMQMNNSQMLKQSQISHPLGHQMHQQQPIVHHQQPQMQQQQPSQNNTQPIPATTNRKKPGQQARKPKKQANQESNISTQGSQSQINNIQSQSNIQTPGIGANSNQMPGPNNGHQNINQQQQHVGGNIMGGSQSNIQEESQRSTPKKTKQKKSGKKAQRKQEEQNTQNEQRLDEIMANQNNQNNINNHIPNGPSQQNINGTPGPNTWDMQRNVQ